MKEAIRRRLTQLESRTTGTDRPSHIIIQVVSGHIDKEGIRWNRISREIDLQTKESIKFTEQAHPWMRTDSENTP
ncbi:MAG: hypothetical protein O7D86_03405 [Proteobacteria bacterium]|nr:hypothetical protein [Pseudomonadota bacterium]